MLAGRKLLLADDSITIQKVVALTFADEGVEVVSVSNGRDAIDKLSEFQPDVVLADVFMPQVSGYEVCRHIKQNEQLRHIPVMLLVGSFEPFDEAEARRVGADDTLTKPFQSIRNLIDKVGSLVSGRAPQELIPTAELPQPDVDEREPEPELLTEAEIEFVTADTQPLPKELRHMVEESASGAEKQKGVQPPTETKMDEALMETDTTQPRNEVSERGGKIVTTADDSLLDLGSVGGGAPGQSSNQTGEFVLDIDLEDDQDASAYQPSAYVRPPVYKSPARDWKTSAVGSRADVATADQLARTQEFPAFISEAAKKSREESRSVANQQSATSEPVKTGTEAVSVEGLSPEVIDAIARRAVEHLSEKVVREIAWEVVPDLAELLIKRQLEEKQS